MAVPIYSDGTDGNPIYPGRALKRNPYTAPETPAGQAIGNAASKIGNAFMPDTRAVLSQSGQDIRDAASRGQYGAAAAHTLRGAAAAVPAIASDIVGAPLRSVSALLPGGGGQQAQQFGRTLLTGSPEPEVPVYTPPTFADTGAMQAAETARQQAADANIASIRAGAGDAGPTSAERIAQMGRDTDTLREMADRSLANSRQGIGVPATPGMGVFDTVGADARQQFFDSAALRTAAAQSSWSPRGGYKANEAAIQAAAAPVQNRQRLQEISLRNAGAERIAANQDATTRRGQDISAATTLRGQELTAASARAQGARDQMNKDRQYALDVQKYGTEVADKNLKARGDAEAAFQKDAETMFRTTDKDGKNIPDEAKVASWKTAVNTTLAEIAKAHEASGDPARMKIAQGIRERGYAALDPAEKRELQQLFNTRERLQQARGMGPNAGSYTHSDNLLSFRQRSGDAGVDRRTLGGDRVVFDNGSSASIRDLQYRDGPANALLPDIFRQRSDELTRNLRGF